MADSIKASDHPDFVGGIVWSELELRWINAQLEQARREEREACAKICEERVEIDGLHSNFICAKFIRARNKQ